MKSNQHLTAHCIVKNEENFVFFAIKSIICHVDKIIVFDTGSTDKTIDIIIGLKNEFPEKIHFEQKGVCSGMRHTELRQEMLKKTETDWFMILDGDEIWTKKGIEEVLEIIKKNNANCIIPQYYLCVGDIYHHSVRGKYIYDNVKIHALPRVFKKTNDIRWNLGPYAGGDYLKDDNGNVVRGGEYVFTRNKYWHTSALIRSSKDMEVMLGRHKQVMTYSLKIIGEGLRIKENIPEVFNENQSKVSYKLHFIKSWLNLIFLILFKFKLAKNRYYE